MVSEIALLATSITISGTCKLANQRRAAGRTPWHRYLGSFFFTRVEEELLTTCGRSTMVSSVSIRAKASLVVASTV